MVQLTVANKTADNDAKWEASMKRKSTYLLIGPVLMVGILGCIWLLTRDRDPRAEGADRVLASSGGGGSIPAAQYLQATDGGMAQYGYSMQQATSYSQTLQAVSDWNSYAYFRSGWSISATLVERLAQADWNARRSGAPGITPEQLAAAAEQLINTKLSTMSAQAQMELYEQMMSETTPKVRWGLNSSFPYATATQNGDGTWRVALSPQAFSIRKQYYQQMVPGMVSSSANFYPGEAMLVAYSVASADVGFGNDYVAKVKQGISDMTGLDMTNRSLFGEQGYLRRRPVTTFLTDAAMAQFFSELGF